MCSQVGSSTTHIRALGREHSVGSSHAGGSCDIGVKVGGWEAGEGRDDAVDWAALQKCEV